jgi:hypothetical protein
MTPSSGLAKGAVEAAAREVARLLGHGSADKNWHPAGSDHRDAKPLWQWCEGEARDAILAFLRHLKEKGPSDQAVLAGARSIGQTMGKPNHNDRSRHCFAAVLGEVISELEQSA